MPLSNSIRQLVKNGILPTRYYVLNELGGNIPQVGLRLRLYRRFGMQFADLNSTTIMMHCEIVHPELIKVGCYSSIGRYCLLDGRGGLTIGNNVNISSHSLLITGSHEVNSPQFHGYTAPISIADRAWVASRVIILPGVQIGAGAVVAAGAVVSQDVAAYTIVGGVPAKVIGERPRNLTYQIAFRPNWQ